MHEKEVYMRIGMALVSIQRVEFAAKKLVEHLILYDKKTYGCTTEEFQKETSNVERLAKYTLGNLLRLLKLNPKLSVESEFNAYRDIRNAFVHNFWQEYLGPESELQNKEAIEFCFKVGRFSEKMESFLKGFTYLLALKSVTHKDLLEPTIKVWESDFAFFLKSLDQKAFDH